MMKVIKGSKGRSNKPKCVYKDNSDCHVEGRWEGTVARDSTRLKKLNLLVSYYFFVYLFIVPRPGFGRTRKHSMVGIVTSVSCARVMIPGEEFPGDPKEVK